MPGKGQKGMVVVSRDQIRVLQPHTRPVQYELGNGPVVVKRADDVQRIMQAARLQTESEVKQRKLEVEAAHQAHLDVAKSRKSRMEQMDAERAHSHTLSDIEIEKQAQNNYLLAKAQLQLDEEQDEVKHLNEMILEAKCMAIRDEQLKEKSKIKIVLQRDEAKMDARMESDRVADIARVAEREKERKRAMFAGAAVIRDQIKQREEVALLEQEKKDQETRHMLEQVARMAKEDAEEKHRKHVEQHQMMDQVLRDNEASIQKRKQNKLDAQEEDRRLMQFLIDRDAEAAKKEQEAEDRKAEREKDLSRLRAMQQKAVDKQAQQDALRAQRAFEATEREYRRKELEAAQRKAKMEEELSAARTKQQQDKEHAIAVEAQKIRDNFEETLQRNKAEEVKRKAVEVQKHVSNREYAAELKAQIQTKEEVHKHDREEFFLEGIRLDKERQEKEAHIQKIKERKLQELQKMGIPDVYTHEIKRKLVSAPQEKAAAIANAKVQPPFATLPVSQFADYQRK